MNLKWQLVSISNMRSILLIKLVATSNWQKFKWSWGVVLTTYLKRVNANYSFPFFHGLSACLTSPILWLGNGGIEQHCGLKIRQVSILWPKRVNASYFFFISWSPPARMPDIIWKSYSVCTKTTGDIGYRMLHTTSSICLYNNIVAWNSELYIGCVSILWLEIRM